MSSRRQPASVTSWTIRVSAVAAVALCVDWALGIRVPSEADSATNETTYSEPARKPRRLELIGERPEDVDRTSRRTSMHPALATLGSQASGIRFAQDSAAMAGDSGVLLDRVVRLLSPYDRAHTVVRVTGRERSDRKLDRILKRKRGRAVIAALVARGMPFTTLSIDTDSVDPLSSNIHRVFLDVDIGNVEDG